MLSLWKACAAISIFCFCVCKMCNTELLHHKHFCGFHGFIEENLWKVQINYLVLCIPQTTIFFESKSSSQVLCKKAEERKSLHVKQKTEKFYICNFNWQFTQLSHWINPSIKTWNDVQCLIEQHRGQLTLCKGWTLAQSCRIGEAAFLEPICDCTD